jgi:hypothetical protein
VAERERLIVSPLKIVSNDQRGAESAESSMRRLEDAQWLQPFRYRGDLVQDLA